MSHLHAGTASGTDSMTPRQARALSRRGLD
jgi:hypothetical protein